MSAALRKRDQGLVKQGSMTVAEYTAKHGR